MMKKFVLFAIILNCMIISKAFAINDINVVINGEKVQYDDNFGYPYIDENNRTMVPLRITLELAGAQVGYDNAKSTAIIMHDMSRIEVPIGTDYIWRNNEKIQNDTFSVVKNGRTYLPIRIIFESLGYTVDWISNSKTINIYNYDYNSNELIGYDTDDLSTLVHDLVNGNVIYIDGKYYATPKGQKAYNNMQYHYYDISRDINEAIYPEMDWRMTPEMTLQFGNNNIFSSNDSTINEDSSYTTQKIEDVLDIEYKDLKFDIHKANDYAYVELQVSFTNKSDKEIAGEITVIPQTRKNDWSNVFKYEYEIEKLEPNETITQKETVILWSTQITDAKNIASYIINGSLHEYGEPLKIIASS